MMKILARWKKLKLLSNRLMYCCMRSVITWESLDSKKLKEMACGGFEVF